jgi:hypothetical protein
MTLFLLAAILAGTNVDVRAHGAKGDGVTLDTAALQQAIDACAAAGGGRVVLDTGRFLCGSLVLKSGVTLTIKPDAVLLGSRSVADYANHRLLSATDASDIRLDGGGTIDGQGPTFWERSKTYTGPLWRGSAQWEYKALARPAFVHFERCAKVRVAGVKLVNSPSWTLHLQRCHDVTVEGVTIRNPFYGPNTDGIDVNSCQDVTIADCDIVTGDDGIVLKSTEPGHDHPSRRITVTGCRVWSACNCLKIGTETHDSFEHITFADCHLYADPTAHPLERPQSGLSIESVDGSEVSDIQAHGLTMSYVRAPLFIRLGHRGGNGPRTQQVEPRVPGRIHDVVIEHVRAEHSSFESSITGIPGHEVEGVTLRDVQLGYEGGGGADLVTSDVPDEKLITHYPEAEMFGRLPAYGLYCRHVAGLTLSAVTCSLLAPDARPMLVADDVQHLRLDDCTAAASTGEFPVYWLLGVRDASFTACPAPPGAKTLVLAEGAAVDRPTLKIDAGEIAFGEPGALMDAGLPRFQEQSPGRVELAAKDLKLTPPMVVTDDWIAVPDGGGRDQGGARGRFEVSVAGDYVVWVRGWAGDGKSKSFYVAIDGSPRCTSDWQRPYGAWGWDNVRDRVDGKPVRGAVGVFALSVGPHVLRLGNRESGMRLARVVIVRRDLGWRPAG